MLCAGHAQRSLPCDHYTSSCTDDPWLTWLFFHVKCIFRNKCLCFKADFLWLVCLQHANEDNRSEGGEIHACVPWCITNALPVQPIRILQLPFGEFILRIILYPALIIIMCAHNVLIRSLWGSWAPLQVQLSDGGCCRLYRRTHAAKGWGETMLFSRRLPFFPPCFHFLLTLSFLCSKANTNMNERCNW